MELWKAKLVEDLNAQVQNELKRTKESIPIWKFHQQREEIIHLSSTRLHGATFEKDKFLNMRKSKV